MDIIRHLMQQLALLSPFSLIRERVLLQVQVFFLSLDDEL